MNKYGQTALLAVVFLESKRAFNPIEAWQKAIVEVFDSPSSQVKGCPKNTFLALCETGEVEGVKPGKYTNSKKNKSYALKAISILQSNPSLSEDPKALWDIVQEGKPIKHNSQMDVVIALWEKGLFLQAKLIP